MDDLYPGAAQAADMEARPGEADIRQSLLTAVDRNPDQEAHWQALAGRYGLPVDAVRLDADNVQRRARLDSVPYADIAATLPATARLLADPAQAAVAHDDVANLSGLEKLFKLQANSRRALAAGYFGFGEGAAGALQAGAEQLQALLEPAAGTLLPVNPAQPLAQLFAGIRRNQADWRRQFSAGADDYLTPAGGAWRNVEAGYYGGLESLSRSLLSLPLAAGGGGAGAALAGMAADTGGESYGHARDAGLDSGRAGLYGAADAAIEYGTEKLGLERLFRGLKQGSPLLGTVGSFLARELPGEQAATALQDMNAWLALHPQRSLQDYLDERPDAALQTAVATLVAGGGQVGVLHGVRALAEHDRRQAATAEAGAAWLQELNGLAAASKVLPRAPRTLRDFVGDVLRSHPDAAQQVYVDAGALRQDGLAADLAAVLPELAPELETALQTGGELGVPLADYVTHVANRPELAAALLPHLRLQGAAFSQAEAAAYMAGHGTTLQREADALLRGHLADGNRADERQALQRQLEAGLGGLVGDARQRTAYAQLLTAYLHTTAERLGVAPADLLAGSGLRFAASPAPQAAPAVAGGQDTDAGTAGTNPASAGGNQGAAPAAGEPQPQTATAAGLDTGLDTGTDTGTDTGAAPGQTAAAQARTLRIAGDGDVAGFVAEAAEFFLDLHLDLARQLAADSRDGGVLDPRQQQLLADVDTLGHWLGVPAAAGWTELAEPERQAAYRRFADGFLQYLRGGQAPVPALQRLFQSFQAWLGRVYRHFGSGGDSGPDAGARAALGRLLAADAAPAADADSVDSEAGPWQDALERVRDDVQQRLDALGHHDGRVNAAYAQLLAAYFGTMAGRLGVRPDEFYQASGLNFASRSPAAAADHRGQYLPGWRRIELLDQADLSTFLHEAGHFFLDMQFELTAGILAQRQQPAAGPLRQPGNRFDAAYVRRMTNDKVLPGRYLTTTRLFSAQTREIGAPRVTSPMQAAQAMAYLSRSPVERCEALLCSRSGKPLAVVGAFKGSPNRVPIFSHTLIAEAYAVKGADSIWIAHNHPWGLHNFSRQDDLGNEKVAELFQGTRLKLRGFLVYGRSFSGEEKFSYEPGPAALDRDWFKFGHYVLPAEHGVTVPVLERVYDREEYMGGYMHLPLTFQTVQELSGGKSGILVANNINMPVAFLELKRADIGTLRGNGRMDRLYRSLSLAGAAMVYIVNYGDLSRAAVYNLLGFLHLYHINVLDLIEFDGDKMSSRKQNNYKYDHFTTFKQPAAASRLVVRDAAGGPELAREDLPPPRQPLTAEQAGALSARQSGLLLLDALRSPRAFVPLAGGAAEQGLRQAAHLSAAEAALLVDHGDLPPAALAGLRELLADIGMPLLHEPAAAAAPAAGAADAGEAGLDGIVADSRRLLDWFGVPGPEAWFRLDPEQRRQCHEQFATAFERYLFEGRAPSLALQRPFAHFRGWLLQIYRSLRSLNVEPGAETRQVMDRMLAGSDEIRRMQALRNMRRLFVSARQADMAPAEFQTYRDSAAAAADAAETGLTRRLLADLQWLRDARNQSLQALQARHDGLRRDTEARVRSAVAQLPEYRAQAMLAAGGRDWHPDVLAELLGFGSGDELRQTLAHTVPMAQKVAQWTDALLLQNHAELATAAARRQAADAEVHNGLRGLAIAIEAQALARAAGEMRVFGDVIEQYLRNRLARQPLGGLRPELYARAEARAGQAAEQAFRGGDLRAAAAHKRRQLLAFHAAREAFRLQAQLAAGLAELDRFADTAEQLPADYREQMHGLLRRFGQGRPAAQPVPLAGWLRARRQEGLAPDIAGFLLDPAVHLPYQRLHAGQFADLLAALRQIEHLGRRQPAAGGRP